MDALHRDSAGAARARIAGGGWEPSHLRALLARVPPGERDAWLDAVLGIAELPDDGRDLPRGCVPYLPSSVEVLLRVVDRTRIRASDVLVDVGAGLGRAAAFVHLVTGAAAIGVEVQAGLAAAARALTARLGLARVPIFEGDAAELTPLLPAASVYLLYCPFGGERLGRWLDRVEPIARTRAIQIACVDLLLPPRPWLSGEPVDGELAIYRSRPDLLEPPGPRVVGAGR